MQAPVNEQHFDAYHTGATTNTPFKPLERIPGLAVGGWFDAGDFDIQGVSHSGTIMSFVAIWEAFHPQHDQTLIDQQLRFVDIHRPDGKPDVLQQIEHGALQIAAQFRAMGRLSRGIVDSHLDTYHHLGDASTQTDNKIYDPSMKPYQTDGIHSGTPDDRWVFVEDSPATSYLGWARWRRQAARFAASTTRSPRNAWRWRRRPTPTNARARRRQRRRTARSRASRRFAELTAVMQLVLTTKEQPYIDRFNELLWPALDRAPAFTLADRGPRDARDGRGLCREAAAYVERYRATLDGMFKQNPYGVPIATGGWAGNGQVIGWATTNYYLHKAFPDLVGTRRRHARARLSLRHAPGAQLLVRVGRRQPVEAPGVRQQPRGLLVHRRRRRAGRADPEARLSGEHGRLAVSLGRERIRHRHVRRRTSSWRTPRGERTFPIVTYALIALNVLFFFVELSGGDAFVKQWAFVPSRFLANPSADFPTFFTSMFMHAGWVHLGGNMLYLWIFGDNVEDRFGHGTFTGLLFGLRARRDLRAVDVRSAGSHVPNLGASGAIAGVLGSYILLFPQGRVRVLQGQQSRADAGADGHRLLDRPAVVQRDRLHRRRRRNRRRRLHGAHRRFRGGLSADDALEGPDGDRLNGGGASGRCGRSGCADAGGLRTPFWLTPRATWSIDRHLEGASRQAAGVRQVADRARAPAEPHARGRRGDDAGTGSTTRVPSTVAGDVPAAPGAAPHSSNPIATLGAVGHQAPFDVARR